jgi:segregation and condensation protein A
LPDYRVNLEVFAGPLDLLLYLVRRDEIDIYDIPIAHITEQYIKYIEMLKQLDIELAGDFLVMAATLMEIKSAMLLPSGESEGMAGEEEGDPRAELIRQLLEYKKFKDAANLLDAAATHQSERFGRGANIVEKLEAQEEPQVDIDQISVWDLLDAFDSVLKATGGVRTIGHIKDDTPIDLYQIEILHRLQTDGPMPFERIFENRNNRLVLVGLFLALLELVREKLVWAEQHSHFDSIYVRALTDEPPEQIVHQAIIQTEGVSELGRPPKTKDTPIPIRGMTADAKKSRDTQKYENIESAENKDVQ